MHPAKAKRQKSQATKRKNASNGQPVTKSTPLVDAPTVASEPPQPTFTRDVKNSVRHLAKHVYSSSRQLHALQLRLCGLSYWQIGQELDITAASAHGLVKRAIQSHCDQLRETAEDVRSMELAKLDKLEQHLWGLLADGGGEITTVESGITANGPVEKLVRKRPGLGGTIDRILAIQQRRAHLLGLDAAQKYEHTGKDGGPISLDALSRIVERGDAVAGD